METSQSELGKRIKRLRTEAHLSQDGLARAVGMSRQTIYDVERGNRKYLQGETLRRFAKALGVTQEEIVVGYKPIKDHEMQPVRAVLKHEGRLSDHDIDIVLRVISGLERLD